MGFVSEHVFLFGMGASILAVGMQHRLLAQPQSALNAPQQSVVSVPFVGCKSDGQVGPLEAPDGKTVPMAIGFKAAQELAYYKSAQGIGTLAPRGWYCFATYGSSGQSLYVRPEPIDTKNIFSSSRSRFAGPLIQVSRRFGDTSGRFTVAEIIARVFPAYQAFVRGVIRDFDQPAGSFPSGPYPTDTLGYRSKTVVEYRTPPQTDGLGTYSWLEKNGSPIEGAAILVGPSPDLMLLAVRLPPDLNGLTPTIINNFERDAARIDADEFR